MRKLNIHMWLSAVLAFLSFFILSCDEALPPRIEPARFLNASLHVQPGSVVEVFIDSVLPTYPITIRNAAGKIELHLRSYYDEVLEGRPFISGNVEVWLTNQPTARTKVQLTEVNVDYPYIESGGSLVLIPGDSVVLAKQWHHVADNGRGFWNFVQLRGRTDSRGFFFESAPVRYSAVATMQVFENVPAEKTARYEFELVYNIFVRYPPGRVGGELFDTGRYSIGRRTALGLQLNSRM